MDTLTFVVVYVLLANHTIAAIRGTENYDLLKSLTDIIDDINDLLKNPVHDDISLKIILGGDYKVITPVYMYNDMRLVTTLYVYIVIM